MEAMGTELPISLDVPPKNACNSLTCRIKQVYSTDNFYLICQEDRPGSLSDLNQVHENQQQPQAASFPPADVPELDQYGSSANRDIVIDRVNFQIGNALPYESWCGQYACCAPNEFASPCR